MACELFWNALAFFYYTGGLLLLFKIYTSVTMGLFKSDKRLDGQVIIVTGCNTGIGKATALDFAKRGAKVIMACRDLTRANQAKDEIVTLSNNKNVVVKHLDLSSLKSVREFAKDILVNENRLDVLVNNAGISNARQKTEDGLELTLQVNHFGHFLLTNLLIDLLRKSAPSRIIHVSSNTHRLGRVNFDDLNCERLHYILIYCVSKLYNIVGSNEFARRLQGSGVTSNSLHPGVVKTEISRNASFFIKLIFNNLMGIFHKNPEEGAQTIIYLAVSDDVKEVSGKYFVDCKKLNTGPVLVINGLLPTMYQYCAIHQSWQNTGISGWECSPSNAVVNDREIGRKFWEKCCDLVGLKQEEQLI